MAGKKRRHPKVRITWVKSRISEEGLCYARLRWMQDGKRYSKSVGHVTPEAAEEAAKDQEAALRLQVDLAQSSSVGVRVDDVLATYLEDLGHRASARHQTSEMTRSLHLSRDLGRVLASQVNEVRLRRYAASRREERWRRVEVDGRRRNLVSKTEGGFPYKRITVIQEIAMLQRAYRLAKDLGVIDCSPPKMPDMRFWPLDARPPRRLTEAEVIKLLDAAYLESAKIGTLLQVFAWSGRRPVAIWALTVSDCARIADTTVERRNALVFWSRDKRGVGRGWGPVTQPAYDAISARLKDLGDVPGDTLLWTTATGLPYQTRRMGRSFERAVKGAGLENVQPYDLRKFAASQIYAATGNLRVTMQFTGHRQPQTLISRYVFAPRDTAEDVAEQIGWTPAPLRLVSEDD